MGAPAATRRALMLAVAAAPLAPVVTAPASPTSPILAMVERYRAISARIGAMTDTDTQEVHLTEEYQRLDVERCTLAGRLITMPVASDAELRAKALCAADWFSGHTDDLGDCLVASILGDLGQQRNWLADLQASDGGWPVEVA